MGALPFKEVRIEAQIISIYYSYILLAKSKKNLDNYVRIFIVEKKIFVCINTPKVDFFFFFTNVKCCKIRNVEP